MPSARTTLTELSTALGFFDLPSLDWAVLQRPPIEGATRADWETIEAELADPRSRRLAEAAFENGQAFLGHADGLRDRTPRLVEWTGGRRPPGDQVIPADLHVDHVYLISCKYLSKIVLNTAPSRLFRGLLQPGSTHDAGDWYEAVAPTEHEALVEAAASAYDVQLPQTRAPLDQQSRTALKHALGRHARFTGAVAEAYENLCATVSARSAEHWSASLRDARRGVPEMLLWRLIRLASATYFVLGVGPTGESLRLRVMTPWDWRQRFTVRRLEIEPAQSGQPQVQWRAEVQDRATTDDLSIAGHVEVRWSHGRFSGPPEAKVYLDTPHREVPGYVPL